MPNPKAGGTWGILTSVAIFAIATALYLNSKGDDLTRVVSYSTARDPGTQVGLLIRWARGHDN
ncbi:hypothetical protein [Nocardia gipuzkoensis]|uniref:hypothetical protein n=1 Tax=Nocardia gipuzkoensis TaxID=2749991 RepID=UPI00237DA97E|nr:hypothetical protein [Nocardia gipuzkoensis]MDE1671156.1 hypothetical protein [Nocardia gipuzkoensis]